MTTYITGGPPRYDHQKRGLQKLIRTGGVCALLFDPGLGKTATTIDYMGLLALKSPRQEARVLVVCPLVAVDTWVSQMGKWASPQVHWWAEAVGGTLIERAMTLAARGGNLHRFVPGTSQQVAQKIGVHPRAMGYERAWALATSEEDFDPRRGPQDVPGPRIILEVINIDTLQYRTKVGRGKTMADVMVNAIERFDPDLIVVDESHKIKAAMGNASRLLSRLTKSVPRRILLTGTVMPHSPLDVYGQWRFLDPFAFGRHAPGGEAKPATFGDFRDRFAVLGGWMGKEVVGFQNLDEMQAIMARNAIVARKKDALDLPPTQDIEVPVHLSPREAKAYAEMKNMLAAQLAKGVLASTSNRLTQMLRLRQITAGYLPDDTGKMHVIGSSKVDTIVSLVNDTLAGEKRVVVFGFFVDELHLIAQGLAKDKQTEVMTISGETSTDERVAMRQRFGSDDPTRIVMVAQIRTMSLAVNELVTANHAVFGSLSQQRDDYIQGRDRLDRIGQTRSVTFWHVVAPGTVDEVILQSHRDRTDLENAMLKHIGEENRA